MSHPATWTRADARPTFEHTEYLGADAVFDECAWCFGAMCPCCHPHEACKRAEKAVTCCGTVWVDEEPGNPCPRCSRTLGGA